MSETGRIFAIIPAAGRSQRMGTAKALLPIDGRPMLLHILDALRAGGAHRIALVTNSDLHAALPDLPQGIHLVINNDPATEMIDSIRLGLETLHRWQPPSGFLVCPCDAAGVTSDDVRRCIVAFNETPDRIIIAGHAGRRGHPLIFPAAMAGTVLSTECDGGLNHLARNRPDQVRLVECASPGTISNVNTPDDYRPHQPG
jgi:molybdenum cofactor cytidylyltransferase